MVRVENDVSILLKITDPLTSNKNGFFYMICILLRICSLVDPVWSSDPKYI